MMVRVVGSGGGLLAKALFLVRKVPSAVYSSIKLLLLFQFLMHTRQERRSDPSSFNCFLLYHTTQVLLFLLFTRQRISSFLLDFVVYLKLAHDLSATVKVTIIMMERNSFWQSLTRHHVTQVPLWECSVDLGNWNDYHIILCGHCAIN